MSKFILFTQITISILLIILILAQRSSGLSGSAPAGDFKFSKRGPEKVVFILTILLTLVYLINGIVNVLLD